MTTLQIIPSRPDSISIGRQSIIEPSTGLGQTSQFIERRLQQITQPSPTFSGDGPPVRNLEEQLYDVLAAFKIRTANVAMHFDRERRSRLFRQLDSLLGVEDWEKEDLPPSIDSFATFLRLLLLLQPARLPGLGATSGGNLIAAWTVGDDRLTIECQPKDFVRWNLSVSIDGERERSAAVTPLRRLTEVLKAYGPERWLKNGNNLSAA